MLEALFIPPYCPEHKLMYAPLNVYMFIVYFYSIYERIIKAKELVKMKVVQDFEDDFSQREWRVKFHTRINSVIDERFSYFIKAILTVIG